MNIGKAMQICHKNNIHIYPIGEFKSNTMFVFYVSVNGKKIPVKEPKKIIVRTKQNKPYKELNDAITKSYIFYAKKIVKKLA